MPPGAHLCGDHEVLRTWRMQRVAGRAALRFNPADFARYLVIARASLMETQNHLIDAVDRGCISEATRAELDVLAGVALQEVTGLMEYLQSPDALRNVRLIRERRTTARQHRRGRSPDAT